MTLNLPDSFKNTKYTDIGRYDKEFITLAQLREVIKKADPEATDDAIFNLFTKYSASASGINKVN